MSLCCCWTLCRVSRAPMARAACWCCFHWRGRGGQALVHPEQLHCQLAPVVTNWHPSLGFFGMDIDIGQIWRSPVDLAAPTSASARPTASSCPRLRHGATNRYGFAGLDGRCPERLSAVVVIAISWRLPAHPCVTCGKAILQGAVGQSFRYNDSLL